MGKERLPQSEQKGEVLTRALDIFKPLWNFFSRTRGDEPADVYVTEVRSTLARVLTPSFDEHLQSIKESVFRDDPEHAATSNLGIAQEGIIQFREASEKLLQKGITPEEFTVGLAKDDRGSAFAKEVASLKPAA